MEGALLLAATIIQYTFGSSHTEYFTLSHFTSHEVREKMYHQLALLPNVDLFVIRRI